MFYNQILRTNVSMPLLMTFTNPSKIDEISNYEPLLYDPISQKIYEMRIVGTKSLKSNTTKKKSASGYVSSTIDRKNEIDDQKYVK